MILLLIACKPTPEVPPDSGSQDTTDTADTADTSNVPDEPPLAHADVVIIGGGASGLSAGLVATAAGASVLILERESVLGGSGTYAGNFFAAGTTWQDEEGIEDSPEQALEEWADFTNGGDPTHPWVQNFVYSSAENLDWLGDYGGSFAGLTDDLGGGSTPRIHTLQPTNKGHPVQVMANLMNEDAWPNTTGVGLIISGGAVIGVSIEDADGTTGWVEGGAVIVATGGFARNDSRVYAVLPELKALPRHTGAWHSADGNGLDLIESVGGALENMENIALYGHSTTDANLGSPEIQLVINVEGGMVVGSSGMRVMNEDNLRGVWGGRAALTHGQLLGIYDSDRWDLLQMTGFGYNYMPITDGQTTASEYATLMDIAHADTLQELGQQLSIDGDVLLQSVMDYNAAVEGGEDTAFGRDVSQVSTLRIAPFYALPLAAATGKSFGGAALAEDGGVLGVDGEVIPGLFAAGEVAGALGGDHIGQGISGSIAAIIYTGRIAGASAAAYAME